MQVLKEEVRNNILQAALSEFRKKGYLQASMRQIALAAGITIGNIYRYFKSKEELFEAIIEPVYEQYGNHMVAIQKIIEFSYSNEAPNTLDYFNKIESALMDLFKTYSAELTILLNQSKGSKYELVKAELEQMTFSILERVFMVSTATAVSLSPSNQALARMLALTLVEGVCLILRDNDEGDTLEQLLDQFLYLYSEGINGIIKQL
ncbi:HTH-type transcriptional regulator MtrR [compost metagenome]